MKKTIFALMLAVLSSCASNKFVTTQCTVHIDSHVVQHEMLIKWHVKRKVIISEDAYSKDVNPRSCFIVDKHNVIFIDGDERWEWK